MSETIRGGLLEAYKHAYGDLHKFCISFVEPTVEEKKYYGTHGLAPLKFIELSGGPQILLVDIVLLPNAKFAWISSTRDQAIDILISNGDQRPRTRIERTTPHRAEVRSIEFDASRVEGIFITIDWRTQGKNKPSPPYRAELGIIPAIKP